MIVRITGNLVLVRNSQAFLELNGITYSVFISGSTEQKLIVSGKIGQIVSFYILHYIEGNVAMGNLTPRLVGFLTEDELDFFTMLITVQGLGVKKALKSLVIPIKDMAKAIELGDTSTLKKMPEIGLKTAQKIIVELKGKVQRFALLDESEIPKTTFYYELKEDYQIEAFEILKQLQYSESDAKEIVCRAIDSFPEIKSADKLIQEIFKKRLVEK